MSAMTQALSLYRRGVVATEQNHEGGRKPDRRRHAKNIPGEFDELEALGQEGLLGGVAHGGSLESRLGDPKQLPRVTQLQLRQERLVLVRQHVLRLHPHIIL
jgi:hypothetical protein